MGRPTGEAGRKYAREWVAARRAAWFSDKSCVICGTKEKLEIHHINPDTKISHNVWSWSKVRRDAELTKCEVRCEEHHMDMTKKQLATPLIHGTATGYGKGKGCRCQACTTAASAERQQYRLLKKMNVGS